MSSARAPGRIRSGDRHAARGRRHRDLGPRRRRIGMGGNARLRAGPAVDAGGRGDRHALAAIGDFADLASPYLVGHSAGVAELAAAAARRCRLDAGDDAALRRAALVHDVGRVAVPAAHLAEARAADAGRVGAGQAARLPLRANPESLAVPGRARADRHRAPRATRRLGLPPRNDRRRTDTGRAGARRRRRLSRDDRAAAAPRGALARAAPPRSSARRPKPAGSTPPPSPPYSRPPGSESRASSGPPG